MLRRAAAEGTIFLEEYRSRLNIFTSLFPFRNAEVNAVWTDMDTSWLSPHGWTDEFQQHSELMKSETSSSNQEVGFD